MKGWMRWANTCCIPLNLFNLWNLPDYRMVFGILLITQAALATLGWLAWYAQGPDKTVNDSDETYSRQVTRSRT